ncbi:putative cwf18 pre-mRNA splicing factor [Paratrimastix pyriformis]|uniref:Cwf18 pre-mRNA splicing factor n=1 Tax=Paratrimastix pyriformis TaxID=342808 RepID=A0ABQ8UQ91_9EUKA|nr:putative cwf18 pre-mRNA splicing factor [Paratrimastix pyriformis]
MSEITEEAASSGDAIQEKPIVFRSYFPKDKAIGTHVPKVMPPKIELNMASGLVEDAQGQINLLSLAPKKVTWDLKRDLQKKLDRLERRTQRAIYEIIREHIQQEAGAAAQPAPQITEAAPVEPEKIDENTELTVDAGEGGSMLHRAMQGATEKGTALGEDDESSESEPESE